MFDKSIINKTGQMWKFYLWFLASLIGGISIFAMVKLIDSLPMSYGITLFLVAIVSELAGMTFAILAIRCPKCKMRWFWHAIRREHFNGWLVWLLTQNECPSCGNKGVSSDLPAPTDKSASPSKEQHA